MNNNNFFVIIILKLEMREINIVVGVNRNYIKPMSVMLISLLENNKEYKINFEYESMGMKSLFRLFDVLDTINNGGIVFVDEIDMSIHDLYLNRLIEFFDENGKGQFIFTAHNTSILDTLKKYKNSIDFMTEYKEIKPWIKNGNYSPRKQYLEGMLPNMPYNIEYYDFFEIFNT